MNLVTNYEVRWHAESSAERAALRMNPALPRGMLLAKSGATKGRALRREHWGERTDRELAGSIIQEMVPESAQIVAKEVFAKRCV
jgi:hypothetical protein